MLHTSFINLKLTQNILLKKTAALLLVAILLCVNAVKVFHTHDNCKLSKQATSSANISVSHHCQICDFHFLQDADNYVAAIQIQETINYPELRTSIILGTSSRPAKGILLRGPPALA